jgi:hypothetical protein
MLNLRHNLHLAAQARRTLAVLLLLGGAGLAYGAPEGQACASGACDSGRIDPAAIRAAVREAAHEVPVNASAVRTAPLSGAAKSGSTNAWERRLGGPGEREDYNCLLSFGFGGTLGSDHFLASRLLGRTQVLRGE